MTGTDRGFFYQRHLPHYQPPDSTFSVMFRPAGTLPFEAIQRLSEERLRYHQLMRTNTSSTEGTKSKRLLKQEQYFRRFDELLDGYSFGPTWLKQEKIAELLSEAIHYRDQKVYDLLAYCIMANHVHMVFSIEGFGIKSGFEKTSKTGRDSVPSYKCLISRRILLILLFRNRKSKIRNFQAPVAQLDRASAYGAEG